MKITSQLVHAMFLMAVAATSTAAFSQEDLAKKKNCMGCHAADKKMVGPSFKEIAAKYAGQADAGDKLATKIIKGGSGAWGTMPMPANPQVSPAEAKQLVDWILTPKT